MSSVEIFLTDQLTQAKFMLERAKCDLRISEDTEYATSGTVEKRAQLRRTIAAQERRIKSLEKGVKAAQQPSLWFDWED